jgi:hypothetical protein
VTPSCNRKGENGNPLPTVGAPEFYPGGRRHGERQQVAQCIDRNIHLRSLAALGSV